jgi:hypothetical protein
MGSLLAKRIKRLGQRTTIRFPARRGDRPTLDERGKGVAQVVPGGLGPTDALGCSQVVNPPAVNDAAARIGKNRLGNQSHSRGAGQNLMRVNGHGKSQAMLARMLVRLGRGKGWVGMNAQHGEASLGGGFGDSSEFRRVSIADGALRIEENQQGALARGSLNNSTGPGEFNPQWQPSHRID